MKRSIPLWQTAGFLFTGTLGTFLHFLFGWTDRSLFASLFSAVNESIWEHMKLLFYPMVLFAILEYRVWGKEHPTFWCIKLLGILLSLALVPVIYYTYTGILGSSADWFNITIFFFTAAVAFYWETTLFQNGICPIPGKVAVSIVCLIAVTFTVLTFLPPHIPFFQDPVTGTYGYFQNKQAGAVIDRPLFLAISMLCVIMKQKLFPWEVCYDRSGYHCQHRGRCAGRFVRIAAEKRRCQAF